MISLLLIASLLVPIQDRGLYAGVFYQYSNQYGDSNNVLSNVAISVEPGVSRRVTKPIIGLIGEANLAVLLHTSSVDEVEQAATTFRSLTSLPLLGYIDNGTWTTCATNPDWVGIMAYRFHSETLTNWNTRIRGMIRACEHKPVMLVVQTYNTNDGLVTNPVDISEMFQYYLAWINDYPNIIGIIAFSDGRSYPDCSRGGMRCFSRWREQWNTLVSLLTGIKLPNSPTGLRIQ